MSENETGNLPPNPPPAAPPPAPSAAPPPAGAPSTDERTWALLAHLSALAGCVIPFGNLIGPFVVWQIKKNEMPFVDDQGKEALNFQITLSLALLVSMVLCVIVIGFLLLPVIGIYGLVMLIIAAINSNNGIAYRYPLTLRLIK